MLEALEAQPRLRQIVTSRAGLFDGNWDLAAYAYQQSFEALWDHAVAQTSGLAAPNRLPDQVLRSARVASSS